jgi:hypothetical protein
MRDGYERRSGNYGEEMIALLIPWFEPDPFARQNVKTNWLFDYFLALYQLLNLFIV